ncbi:MAG: tyrosine-type recombinase/integrase [Ktedonobacterales bacterium]|nr:tyrosine-type recombinase/integrase [Ktedonobacterales bacterium]
MKAEPAEAPPARKSSPPAQTLESVLHRYVNWHEAEGHSRKTEQDAKTNLRPFFRYLKTEFDITHVEQVEVDNIRSWLVWLRNTPSQRKRPRSSKTIESYCRQVMAFFRWCMAEEIVMHNPLGRLKLPRAEKKIIRVFSDEEIKRMHEACQPNPSGLRPDVRRMLTTRNRAIMWVLLDTGMRASELGGIRFMDFDRKRGTVYIMGKGAKERKLLLGQHSYHYLTAYLDHWRGESESGKDRLFLTDDGSSLTLATITKMFARLKTRGEIPDKRVSAHTCRHWYAVRFLLEGGKLFALQKLLGHETLEMVRIYANIADTDAEEEQRKYSPADRIELEPTKVKRRGFRQG